MDNKIVFKPGVDEKLFWLLYFLHRPFLNKKYAQVDQQYTIYQNKRVQGQICLDETVSPPSIQICLLSEHTVRADDVVRQFIKPYKYKQYEWTFHKDNYESMGLLARLKGYIVKVKGDIVIGRIDLSHQRRTVTLEEEVRKYK